MTKRQTSSAPEMIDGCGTRGLRIRVLFRRKVGCMAWQAWMLFLGYSDHISMNWMVLLMGSVIGLCALQVELFHELVRQVSCYKAADRCIKLMQAYTAQAKTAEEAGDDWRRNIHMAQARAVVSEAILWHNRAKTWGE